jgi:ubiquinone/menaquinone biosynthesis C-methylase UbiE
MKKLEEYFDKAGSESKGDYVPKGSWPDKAQHRSQQYVVNKILGTGIKSLIDLGCGNGELIRELYSKNSKLKLVGVDFSKQMILEAKRRQPNVRWLRSDIAKVPLKGAEALCCINVLHHLSPLELDKVIKEMARLSTKMIILEIKNNKVFSALVMWIDLKFFKKIPVYLHDVETIEKKLKKYGYKKMDVKWLFGSELISPFGIFVFEHED